MAYIPNYTSDDIAPAVINTGTVVVITVVKFIAVIVIVILLLWLTRLWRPKFRRDWRKK